MENGNSERWPPGVKLFDPLVHDCGWTHNNCWTQTSISEKTHKKENINKDSSKCFLD